MDIEASGYIAGPPILSLGLVVLLVIAAAQDLKTKEVSGWLTLFPLLATVAWRVATGGWVLLAAFVIIALFSERVMCQSRSLALAAIVTGLVAVFFFLPGSPAYWTLLGWLAAWLLWEFNVIGGADVKLMMLLMTVYPDPRMLFLILLAKLVAGLIVPAALYGRRAARRLLSAAFLVLAARQMPDRETLEREGLPAVFVYTMAGIAYVLVFAPQCLPRNGAAAPLCGVELGDPITWGSLALAFAIGTVPIALFLRSVPRPAGLRSTLPCGQHWVPSKIPWTAGHGRARAGLRSALPCGQHWVPSKIPWTAGRAAGLPSPQSGRLDSAVDCTRDRAPEVGQNGHAGHCRPGQRTHTAQTREE